MDTAQWAQGNIGVVKVPMVELGSNPIPKPLHVAPNNSNPNPNPGGMLERKARPQKDQALNCPRCNSSNTKFCYYNNYSLSQPRYFCKTCRRYWTEGGSLRNVPVGGGSRKNKRPSSSSSSSSNSSSNSNLSSSVIPPSSKKLPEASCHNAKNNNIIHQPQDLNLAYPPPPHEISSTTCATRGLNLMTSLMPMSVSDHGSLMYSSDSTNNTNTNNSSGGGGFIPLQEFKPLHQGLNFSFEGFDNTNGYVGGFQGMQLGASASAAAAAAAARILFPIEDLKHVPSTTTTTTAPTHEFEHHNHNRGGAGGGGGHGDSTGFWSGMLGGGSW